MPSVTTASLARVLILRCTFVCVMTLVRSTGISWTWCVGVISVWLLGRILGGDARRRVMLGSVRSRHGLF